MKHLRMKYGRMLSMKITKEIEKDITLRKNIKISL